MEGEEEKKSAFKFKDSRRFDSEGNERDQVQAAAPTANAGNTQKAAAPKGAPLAEPVPNNGSSEDAQDEIDLSSFIVSLGTQALMQLGVIKPPDGIAMPIDKASAKQTIDIISMLEKRTKSSLTPDEQKLVTEILHSLRMSFVKVK